MNTDDRKGSTSTELVEAVATGREIAFAVDGRTYFLSRHSDDDWYLYCEETKDKQTFPSGEVLLSRARIEGESLEACSERLEIQTIY